MGLPVAGGCHAGDRLEHAIKMRQIGKSSFLADLRNVLVRLHEFALGIHDPGYIYIMDQGAVGVFLKFPAQIIRAYIKHLGKHVKINIVHIVGMHIADHLADAGAFLRLCLCLRPFLPDQLVQQQTQQCMLRTESCIRQ